MIESGGGADQTTGRSSVDDTKRQAPAEMDDDNDIEGQPLAKGKRPPRYVSSGVGRTYRAVKAWCSEWLFVGRSLVSPDDANTCAAVWHKCAFAAATCRRDFTALAIVFALMACGLLSVLAMVALTGALGAAQILCVYAFTPPCVTRPNTLQCAVDSAAVHIHSDCVKKFLATYPDGPPEGVTLDYDCAYSSIWVGGVVVFAVEVALVGVLVSMAVLCVYAVCLCRTHLRTLAARIAFHRSKWRSLTD